MINFSFILDLAYNLITTISDVTLWLFNGSIAGIPPIALFTGGGIVTILVIKAAILVLDIIF